MEDKLTVALLYAIKMYAEKADNIDDLKKFIDNIMSALLISVDEQSKIRLIEDLTERYNEK